MKSSLCHWLQSRLIFRPHGSTTYVDAAYCYTLACSVGLSQSRVLQKRLNRSRWYLGF